MSSESTCTLAKSLDQQLVLVAELQQLYPEKRKMIRYPYRNCTAPPRPCSHCKDPFPLPMMIWRADNQDYNVQHYVLCYACLKSIGADEHKYELASDTIHESEVLSVRMKCPYEECKEVVCRHQIPDHLKTCRCTPREDCAKCLTPLRKDEKAQHVCPPGLHTCLCGKTHASEHRKRHHETQCTMVMPLMKLFKDHAQFAEDFMQTWQEYMTTTTPDSKKRKVSLSNDSERSCVMTSRESSPNNAVSLQPPSGQIEYLKEQVIRLTAEVEKLYPRHYASLVAAVGSPLALGGPFQDTLRSTAGTRPALAPVAGSSPSSHHVAANVTRAS